MENASKALMIAGGILIVLLLITGFLYMQQSMQTMREAEEQAILTEQLQKFNKQYEAYNKKLMYGAEVQSLINKMKDNNVKYANDANYQMSYELIGFSENQIEKTDIYTCTNIQYSSITGRVLTMTFKKYET